MRIDINWMDGWGNSPEFVISNTDYIGWPRMHEPAWEKRGCYHRADRGVFVCYFHTDGKPTSGFGGATFTGTLINGERFEYIGAWSSRAGCVNQVWDDRRIVDVVLKSRPDGSSNVAIGMRADAIIGWHEVNRPEWGLAWCRRSDGEWILEPVRDGHVKRETDYELIEHIAAGTELV